MLNLSLLSPSPMASSLLDTHFVHNLISFHNLSALLFFSYDLGVYVKKVNI